jgi:hypothetical protein
VLEGDSNIEFRAVFSLWWPAAGDEPRKMHVRVPFVCQKWSMLRR